MKALIFLVAGIARHHHQQLGEGAVRAPELLAVQDVGIALRRALGGGGEAGRVGADRRLGQGEGRDRPCRAARQIALLLLRGAEVLERLGEPDRLMRREKRGDVPS